MDINAFLTTENIQSNSAAAKASGGKNGIFAAAPDLGFINMIITRLEHSEVEQVSSTIVPGKAQLLKDIVAKLDQVIADAKTQGIGTLQALDNFAAQLNEQTGLNTTGTQLLDLLNQVDLTGEIAYGHALNDEAKLMAIINFDKQKQTDGALIATSDELTANQNDNEALQDFLNHLLQGIPESSRPEIINVSSESVKKALENLEYNPNSDAAIPALVATDLTPEELSNLIDDIRKQTEDGQSFMVGIVKLNSKGEEAVFVPAAIVLPHQEQTQKKLAAAIGYAEAAEKQAQTDVSGAEIIASQLNALSTGTEGQTGDFDPAADNQRSSSKGLSDMLRVLENAQGRAGSEATHSDGTRQGANQNAAQNQEQQNSNAQNRPFVNIMMAQSGDLNFIDLSGLDFTGGNMDMFQNGTFGQSASLTGPGSIAGLVTQAPSAGSPHPATQAVAAQLSKAAAKGDSQTMTIKMSPPELGRVEVRMEFSNDSKKLKTHIVVEKPETYAMLQRDSHMLERALQDSGLDVGDTGLSFELSQDGNLFDQNPDGQGKNASGGSSGGEAGETEEAELIESTVDWYIDPQTGLTRYDILA